MKTSFIFAETAFHHQGDFEYLDRLVDAAVEAGVDGIKFQVLLDFDELISRVHPAYEQLRAYTFTESEWRKVLEKANSSGLRVVVMPLDSKVFNLIRTLSFRVKYLELHSVSFNDTTVKQLIKASNMDLILSVGGRTIEEVDSAFGYFGNQLKVLMVGFQAFPSKIEDVKLNKIALLKQRYHESVIGFADHSGFADPYAIESSSIAFALGARVFEKHLTIEEGVSRVDYESAIGVAKLAAIRSNIEELCRILGHNNSFELSDAEQNYRKREKMVVASRDIPAGTILQQTDLCLKMVGRFDGSPHIEQIEGKKLIKTVQKDHLITLNDVTE
jgi:Sialic acid synthase